MEPHHGTRCCDKPFPMEPHRQIFPLAPHTRERVLHQCFYLGAKPASTALRQTSPFKPTCAHDVLHSENPKKQATQCLRSSHHSSRSCGTAMSSQGREGFPCSVPLPKTSSMETSLDVQDNALTCSSGSTSYTLTLERGPHPHQIRVSHHHQQQNQRQHRV